MPRHRKPTPSYLEHKQSSRARAVWTDTAGVRQFRMLPSAYDSPESRTAFAGCNSNSKRHRTNPTTPPRSASTRCCSLHAARGRALPRRGRNYTNEFDEYKVVARYVREVYGETPAAKFGPLALKAIRRSSSKRSGAVGSSPTGRPGSTNLQVGGVRGTGGRERVPVAHHGNGASTWTDDGTRNRTGGTGRRCGRGRHVIPSYCVLYGQCSSSCCH